MLEDVIRAERAEQEIDAFVTRRALKMNPEQRRVEEDWMKLARIHNARHREAALRLLLEYHEEQLVRHTRTFELLLKKHRVGLRLCREQLGIPVDEGDAA